MKNLKKDVDPGREETLTIQRLLEQSEDKPTILPDWAVSDDLTVFKSYASKISIKAI